MNIKEDNVFLLFIDGNIIIFELNDDKFFKINLKIINQFYCHNIRDFYLQNLSKNENKFYHLDYRSNNISVY